MSPKKYLALALALTLGACGSISESKKEDALDATLNAYGASVRWMPLGNAYQFLHPDLAEQVQIQPGLDKIRVVSYDVVVPPISRDENTVVQTAIIGYIRIEDQKVRELTDQQTWTFEPETKAWSLSSEIPSFR